MRHHRGLSGLPNREWETLPLLTPTHPRGRSPVSYLFAFVAGIAIGMVLHAF